MFIFFFTKIYFFFLPRAKEDVPIPQLEWGSDIYSQHCYSEMGYMRGI